MSARSSSLTSHSTSSSSAAAVAVDSAASIPQKVSSDTQTTASAVQSAHIRRQLSEMAASASSRSAKARRRDESSGSLHSDSTAGSEEAGGKSSSNSNNSASSVDSVVCRVASCDDDTQQQPQHQQQQPQQSRAACTDHIQSLRTKKHDNAPAQHASSAVTGVKPMPPIVRSAYLRTTTGGAAAADVSATSSPRAGSRDSAASRLGVHRPLIDQRAPAGWSRDHHDPAEGCGGGYMSDGDIVRTAACARRPDDANCGYMSEGGVSLYMQRMQQRFREGMLAVRESLLEKNNNALTDDDRSDTTRLLARFLSLCQSCCIVRRGHMRTVQTCGPLLPMFRGLHVCVCLYVCLLDIVVSCAETAEPIEIPVLWYGLE